MANNTEDARGNTFSCHACQQPLKALYNEPRGAGPWDGALIVSFDGGYGMFFDLLVESPQDRAAGRLRHDGGYRVVICKDCSRQLCNVAPWVEKLLADGYAAQ